MIDNRKPRRWPAAFLLVVAVGTLIALHAKMNEDARRAADFAAIEELHRKDIAATKTYDVETLVSLWTDDIVALPLGASPTIGKAVGRKQLEAGKAASAAYEVLAYEQKWEEVTLAGDYAFEWGTFTSAVRPKAGGDEIRQNYNVLRVLKRAADGSWKVHRTIWNASK
jgi:ketosteroid isomerase-like protein